MSWFKKKPCCNGHSAFPPHKNLTVGLVGNPNCGKTTVFNALTGSCQRVGNWPGVTVERKSGFFMSNDTTVEVVDLPGVYSLTVVSESSSIDERIACETILSGTLDVIINILDASNLERHLYLTLQLIEMRVPMIIAVNMMDVAQQRDVRIAIDQLQKKLGCPVLALEANKGQGINELKQRVFESHAKSFVIPSRTEMMMHHNDTANSSVSTEIKSATHVLNQAISCLVTKTGSEFLAIRLLEDDVIAYNNASPELQVAVKVSQEHIRTQTGEDADILLADARYRVIHTIMTSCVSQLKNAKPTLTSRIDNIVLNRILGIPIFLSVMYVMFFFAINIGGAFQDFFDILSNTFFVGGLSYVLTQLHAPTWLTALLANGVGKGINTTMTFIPVIGAMFLFLAFLEDSGYMARAAFVVDRVMRMLGLPGKSFVPMVIGFGCNVPSVMAARTLDNKRDRILTVMMSPFMSCGARLAIYAVFTAAFFPVGGQNIIFALYVIGILMAMLTGFLLRKTVLQGDPAPLVMELPPYHVPNINALLLHAWQRLKGFVFRAGKLIVPICILIGVLNTLNVDGTLNSGNGDSHSLLSTVGQWVTPIFAPMGIHQDNWPATVGLVTGVLAKEVVVGTLNTLYSQFSATITTHVDVYSFWGGIQDAFISIPAHLAQLGGALSNPLLAKAPAHALSQTVYGEMFKHFDGQIGAIAYLLFVLLYFPCVSTTAAMLREVNKAWTVFSIVWTTGTAYCVAVLFYQIATWMRHPLSSSLWVAMMVSIVAFAIVSIRRYAKRDITLGEAYGVA